MLINKSDWIKKKIEEIGGFQKRDEISFQDGDILLLLGNKIKLDLFKGKNSRTKITIENNNIVAEGLHVDDNSILKKAVIKYYRKIALEYFSENTDKIFSMHSEIFRDKTNPKVKIRYYKRRWGSTSNSGTITYNWRLIMAPKSTIDYVIIHELVHFIHFDHSKNYWNVVEKMCPDYKSERKWLKKNAFKLDFLRIES